MIALLLGGAALVALMLTLGMFSNAQVNSIKSLGIWVVAIGGVLLATLLFFTGRATNAIAALLMLVPLLWSWTQNPRQMSTPFAWLRGPLARWLRPPSFQQARKRQPPPPPPPSRGAMSRDEAYAVLGLRRGADTDAVRAAHKRLMRFAHPDSGGSDWLAARINQARDTLLG